jgi:hypothetical protein
VWGTLGQLSLMPRSPVLARGAMKWLKGQPLLRVGDLVGDLGGDLGEILGRGIWGGGVIWGVMPKESLSLYCHVFSVGM